MIPAEDLALYRVRHDDIRTVVTEMLQMRKYLWLSYARKIRGIVGKRGELSPATYYTFAHALFEKRQRYERERKSVPREEVLDLIDKFSSKGGNREILVEIARMITPLSFIL